MRISLLFIVPIALLAVLVGAILSFLDVIDGSKYGWYAGVIGTVASLAGLYGITKRLSASDFDALDITSIERIRRAAEEIEKSEKRLEETRSKLQGTQNELLLFETRKEQLEIIARKASLKVFLEEQLRFKEAKILEIIKGSSELRSSILQTLEGRKRLEALSDEIEKMPPEEIALLQEVLEAERVKDPFDVVISVPFFGATVNLAKIVRAFAVGIRH